MSTTATAGAASQQLRALEQANRVRLARAQLKRQVGADRVTAAQVILECPWEAASMSLDELLRSQRRWGAARCRRLLVSLGVAENKQIGRLTPRQRALLAAALRSGGGDGAHALGSETIAGASPDASLLN